jgi:hypothetical protein
MFEKQGILHSHEASLEAMIQYNSSGYHRHKLRDIRLNGAFVEMGNVRVLQQQAPVKVVFVYHDKGTRYTHMVHAKVREISQGGALLEFYGLDHLAYDALRKLESDRRQQLITMPDNSDRDYRQS